MCFKCVFKSFFAFNGTLGIKNILVTLGILKKKKKKEAQLCACFGRVEERFGFAMLVGEEETAGLFSMQVMCANS